MKGSRPILATTIAAGLLGGSVMAVAAQSRSPEPASFAAASTSSFEPPFEYSIPATMDPSALDERSIAFGVAEGTAGETWGEAQDSADKTGAHGVIVMDLTSAVTHPCGPGYQNRGPLADTPEGFLDDMQTKAGLVLTGLAAWRFDGRPALAAASGASKCGTADLHIGGAGKDVGRGEWFRLDVPSRIIVTEVAGKPILVQAWAGTPEDLEAWLPIANEFIDAIHFVDPVDS